MRQASIGSILNALQDRTTVHLKRQQRQPCAEHTKPTVKRYTVDQYVRKKQSEGSKMYRNNEGYRDPTAGKAISDAYKVSKHTKDALKAMHDVASLLGFELVELRDKKTGRTFKCSQKQ